MKRIHQYEAYAEGVISKEVYLAAKDSLTEQISQLQNRLNSLDMMIDTEESLSGAVAAVASQANAVHGKLTKEAADTFVKSVVIYGPDRIEITFTFDDLLENAMKKAEEISNERNVKSAS